MILFSNCCFNPLRISFGEWIGQQCSGSSYATNYFKITSWWNMLATACIWPLFFLQPKKKEKADGSLNHCSLYLKQVFQLGAKKLLFSTALKNHQSPAADKNFPFPHYSQDRIEIFCIFGQFAAPEDCALSCQMSLMINTSFIIF